MGVRNLGASLDSLASFQNIQITALATTSPARTGSITFHMPRAPSLRISMVDMKIPNIRIPLNANSGAPAPYAGSLKGAPLSSKVKQSSPAVV